MPDFVSVVISLYAQFSSLVRESNRCSNWASSSLLIFELYLASWMLSHTAWMTCCWAIVIGLAGTLSAAWSLGDSSAVGMREISIIAASWECGGAGRRGWNSTLIGMPLFRRRWVPRWKGFSFLDLARWAWKGPEM